MTRYEPKAFPTIDEDAIRNEMGKRGYDPQRVEEPPGAVYEPHKNPTDLLLVYLEGSATVRVGNQEFHCSPGDRLHISGNVEHSATIGKDGVVYLLTEIENMGD